MKKQTILVLADFAGLNANQLKFVAEKLQAKYQNYHVLPNVNSEFDQSPLPSRSIRGEKYNYKLVTIELDLFNKKTVRLLHFDSTIKKYELLACFNLKKK